ncbi:MAG: M14 family metallopeptidase [Thermoanaerobaculia bacterium]
MIRSIHGMLFGLLAAVSSGWASPAVAPSDWATPAEKSEYATTPRYDETMKYLRRIAAAAPKQVRLEVFGKTGEGRDLVAVVASRDGVFDPQAIHRAGRPIVLIQNAIHPGEMDGKDACLALLRDMAVTRTQTRLLDRAVVLILPIYNADGHERFGPHNRINQNGPEEAGWRTTAVNLNLNRDYMKADTPETRAFLRLWNRWLPDYFVDDHVTDGADYQYDVTFGADSGPDLPAATAAWQRDTVAPEVEASVDRAGHLAGPLINFKEPADPASGLIFWPSLPRFSTGYAILQSRPALLVEMHMLKDYRTRVLGNYEVLRALLEIVNRDALLLVRMNREADAATVAAGTAARRPIFPLLIEADPRSEPWIYKGFRSEASPSEISGGTRISYTRDPVDLTIPRETGWRVAKTVVPPAGYIVPAPWTEVTELLSAHGVRSFKTSRPWKSEVETYRCENPRWNPRPFEGRQVFFWPGEDTPKADAALGPCRAVRQVMTFPAGSAVVPLGQRAGKVAIHLLEPEAPDSAVAWGFFNAIFEQKEFGEDYVMETLSREMLAKDPELRAEFEAKLAGDPAFAASPRARLDFFFQRSPWRDPRQGLYPVGRLSSLDGIPIAK